MTKLEYQDSETPEPIVTKFGLGDCVSDVTPHAKIQTDLPRGGVPANEWNITHVVFIFSFIVCDPIDFARVPRLNRRTNFCRLIRRMSVPGYCIPRGIKLQIFSNFPHFYPPKHLQKERELAFSSLTLKILKLAYYRTTAPIATKFCTVTKDHHNTPRGWSIRL